VPKGKDTRGELRVLLKPVIDAWPDVIQPKKAGRSFRKEAVIALLDYVLVEHVNFNSSPGDILFANGLKLPGLKPHAPTLEELGKAVGQNRHKVGVVMDWLVDEQEPKILDRKNHGRLRAQVWSFKPLLDRQSEGG
jgi:hypothetical protein